MYPVGYDVNSFVSDPGERYQTRFVGERDLHTGAIILSEVGKVDLWQMHSACADECDINNIVTRFQNGDISVLNRVQGSYLDLVGLPNDLRGMSDLVAQLHAGYDQLPQDVRDAFGSYEAWISSAGSDEWIQRMTPRSESVSGSDEQQAFAATT